MADLPSWRTTASGPGADGAIVAVDFANTGRPDSGFGALVPRLDTDHSLWETVVPEPGTEAGMGGGDYLDRWTGELAPGAPAVAAVFGYCASSTFALALADRIAGWQRRPNVVLFDPTRITGPTVLRYGFTPVIDSLLPVLGEEDVERARESAAEAVRTHTGLAPLCAELLRIYAEAGTAAFQRIGLPADRAEELVAWFRAYLRYVAAASALPVGADPAGVTVIRANDLPDGPFAAERELRFDVPHTGLLGHPGVADAVTALLRA
ncbi:hypothetical protein [Streptomyces sp. HPF1205]|uniref:hypothetical protein n=1 Tax=Streptomyces sp. HPF1205 TaxID=2873262 RepID=UPI001CEDEBDF|nr:hypothetical protein [Streptomyces sp. HPF1205]